MNELLNELLNQCRAIRPDVRYITLETHYSDKGIEVFFYAHASNVAFGGDTVADLLADIRRGLKDDASIATNRLMSACGIPVGAA